MKPVLAHLLFALLLAWSFGGSTAHAAGRAPCARHAAVQASAVSVAEADRTTHAHHAMAMTATDTAAPAWHHDCGAQCRCAGHHCGAASAALTSTILLPAPLPRDAPATATLAARASEAHGLDLIRPPRTA